MITRTPYLCVAPALCALLVIAGVASLTNSSPVFAQGAFTRPAYGDAIVTTTFSSSHPALDYYVSPGREFPVLAALGGTIEAHDYICQDGSDENSTPPCTGYGNYVDVIHSNGYKTRYAHVVRGSSLPTGTAVAQGDQIAVADDTGRSTANHVHFEVIDSTNQRLNPSDPANCLWTVCPDGVSPATPAVQVMPPPWTTDPANNTKTDFAAGETLRVNVSIRNTSSSQLNFSSNWVARDANGNNVPALSWSGTLTQAANTTAVKALDWTVPSTLAPGLYTFRISANYDKETFGVVTFRVGGNGVACAAGQFKVDYFNNITLSGAPVYTTCESAPVDHNWGLAAPANGVTADTFSARWNGTFAFSAGTYRFTAGGDDGYRLFVDGVKIIDRWSDHSYVEDYADRVLSDGNHTVVYEFYENVYDARAKTRWDKVVDVSCPKNQFKAQYFNNKTLSGTPAYSTCETPPIDRDWNLAAPASGVNADNFSVRWSGTFAFSAGTFRFTVGGDDGFALALDGVQIVADWTDHSYYERTVDRSIAAGDHLVTFEFYDGAYLAHAKVRWDSVPTSGRTVVIIDDLASGFQRFGPAGYWYGRATGYNGHMYWTYDNGSTQTNYARWRPNLAGGNYEVHAYIPCSYATTRYARYVIAYGGGTANRTVNQYSYCNAWVSLGTYNFAVGTTGYVELSDRTYEAVGKTQVGFDAVRFTPR